MFNNIFDKIKNQKPVEPSRRLGWHTYYNNLATQYFLKTKVFFYVAVISASVSIAVPLVLNGALFSFIAKLYDIFSFFGTSVVYGAGERYLIRAFETLGSAILYNLFWSILIFMFLVPAAMKYLARQAEKAYRKKYIRGIAKMPMSQLIEELKNEP